MFSYMMQTQAEGFLLHVSSFCFGGSMMAGVCAYIGNR